MATLATQPNAASDVFPGGVTTLRVQFETSVNSGQACGASGVTIGITASGAPDSGTGTPVAATSAGVQALGTGLYEYDWSVPESAVPGSYLVTWTGTRASDSTEVTYTQAVNVAANPEAAPLPGLYASVAQYRAWSGDSYTPAQIIQVKLQRATEDIDVALVAAVYRTDADGMPLDAQLASVLVRATSAQVQYLLAQNDDSGIKREFSSTSVGGVSATRAASQQGGALPRLGPRALSILRVAGVLPASPLINWLAMYGRIFAKVPAPALTGRGRGHTDWGGATWLMVRASSAARKDHSRTAGARPTTCGGIALVIPALPNWSRTRRARSRLPALRGSIGAPIRLGFMPATAALTQSMSSGRTMAAGASRCASAGSTTSRYSLKTWATRRAACPSTASTTTATTSRATASGRPAQSSRKTSGAGRTASRVSTACLTRRMSTSIRPRARRAAISACLIAMPDGMRRIG